jgi:hypothetical protein
MPPLVAFGSFLTFLQDPGPEPHQCQNSGAVEAQNGAMKDTTINGGAEVQNVVVEGLQTNGCKFALLWWRAWDPDPDPSFHFDSGFKAFLEPQSEERLRGRCKEGGLSGQLAERKMGRAGWTVSKEEVMSTVFLPVFPHCLNSISFFLFSCSRWNLGQSALRSPNSFRWTCFWTQAGPGTPIMWSPWLCSVYFAYCLSNLHFKCK